MLDLVQGDLHLAWAHRLLDGTRMALLRQAGWVHRLAWVRRPAGIHTGHRRRAGTGQGALRPGIHHGARRHRVHLVAHLLATLLGAHLPASCLGAHHPARQVDHQAQAAVHRR